MLSEKLGQNEFVFVEVSLIYNVVLVSDVQQSDLLYIYIYMSFSITVYYKILNMVSCGIQ